MLIEKITKTVTANRWITIAITIFLTCFFFYGLIKIEFLADVKDMLPEGEPSVTSFEEVDETFGGADFVMLALEANEIFTRRNLEVMEFITVGIEELKGVSGVRSLINAGEIQGVEYGIEVVDLIDEIPTDREALKELKERVLSDEDYAGNLVSRDGQVAMIVIQLLPEAGTKSILREIDRVVEDSGFSGKTHLMGMPVTEDYLARAVAADMKKLIPFVILVVIVVLLLTLRSFQGVLLPLLVVMFSTIWALGLMGFLGVPLSNVSNILPIVLISVGTAYAIHILAHYREEISSQQSLKADSKREALIKTMGVVGVAILLAGITTMAGFLANIFSSLRPIKEMGFFTAFGIGAAFLISITFVPASLSLAARSKKEKSGSPKKKRAGFLSVFLNNLSIATSRSSWVVLSLAAGLAIIASLLLSSLRTEFNLINYYKPDSPPVKSLKLMEEKFGGSDVIQVLVKGDIQDPDVLRSMEKFQSELKQINSIGRPYSLVNILKDVNEALNEGDSAFRVLPQTMEEVAQFLLLLSLSGAEDLDKIISFDYDRALIMARVSGSSVKVKKEMIRSVEQSIEKNFSGGKAEAILTGMPVLEQDINELIVKGQLKSLLFAVLFVFILMIIVTRSLSYGAICTVPIALTVVLNFGVMSLFNIPLDVATAMIASVAIGIGVDYSIHFFNRYKLEKQAGRAKEEAVQTATTSTGKAILYNALAVGLGFLVLAFSSFPPLCNFGWLIALTMVFSSGGALTVLPALLMVKDRKQKKDITNGNINEEVQNE